jgi:hypothetical protein
MSIFEVVMTYPAGLSATPTDYGPRSIPSQILESSIGRLSSNTDTASRSIFVDFGALRQRIRDTASLPLGWDLGSAGPMSTEAIQNAISLVNALESARISPPKVIPTCDDSILIRYHLHNQIIEWEFFCDGDNVRVQIEPDGAKSYLEIRADQIGDYI